MHAPTWIPQQVRAKAAKEGNSTPHTVRTQCVQRKLNKGTISCSKMCPSTDTCRPPVLFQAHRGLLRSAPPHERSSLVGLGACLCHPAGTPRPRPSAKRPLPGRLPTSPGAPAGSPASGGCPQPRPTPPPRSRRHCYFDYAAQASHTGRRSGQPSSPQRGRTSGACTS